VSGLRCHSVLAGETSVRFSGTFLGQRMVASLSPTGILIAQEVTMCDSPFVPEGV
jgi:hypothetical protein